MNELSIYDVSAAVYAGNSRKEEFFGYPVGGIRYLMERVAVDLVSRDCIVMCFDSPSFRVKMNNGYKNGREKNPSVYSQIETLYEGLQQCGIQCFKFDGYEADDLIEWAVAQNNDRFVRGITIHSGDMDLCHSIRAGVLLKTLNPSMNDISVSNFETGIYRGKKIPYNTISAYKVFCGCASDTIPVLKLKSGYSGYQLFRIWCDTISKIGPLNDRSLGANPVTVTVFAKKSGLFTDDEMAEVDKRIRLIYPASMPDGVTIEPTSWSDVDKEKLGVFLNLYGVRVALRCLKLRSVPVSDSEKALLLEKARALKTGAYAADRNIEHNTKSVRTTLIDLDAFTRGY